MDLIDRYLDTVRMFLPRDQRDDIAAELRDVLMTRREERQGELGRTLTRKEEEQLVHAFGHPLVVAARYGQPQYLIGPELYPVYAFVLRIVLAAIGLAALITGIVAAVTPDGGGGPAVSAALGVAWNGCFVAIGVVTLIFAGLQRTPASQSIVTDWRVSDLPRMSRRRRRQGWPEHVAGIVVQSLFLLWWVGLIQVAPPAIPIETGGAMRFAFAPALHPLYLPVLALSAGAIAVNGLRLAGREGRTIARAADAALQLGLLVVAGLALRAGVWVAVTGVGVPQATLVGAAHGVNIGAQVTLIAIALAALVRLASDAWRLYRPEPEAGGA
jgi:hypothetical protein